MYHAMSMSTAADGTVTLTLRDTDGREFTTPLQGTSVTDTDLVHYNARMGITGPDRLYRR